MDPNSARADELRKLLDVVAGQALDEQGRISEPIVKDEMAIVDFLTAKANSSNAQNLRNSAPFPPYSHILPLHRNPPTNREQRPVREDSSSLRPRSESMSQNQRPSARTPGISVSASSPRATEQQASPWQNADSAWSFVAPGMNQIDVQQPFGQPSSLGNSMQRVPRPLRPPRTGRDRSDSDVSNRSVENLAGLAQGLQQYQSANYQTSPSNANSLRPPESLLRTAFDTSVADNPNNVNANATAGTSNMANNEFPMYDSIPTDTSLNIFSDPWLDGAYAMLGMGDGGSAGSSGSVEFNPFALSQFGMADGEAREGRWVFTSRAVIDRCMLTATDPSCIGASTARRRS